MAQLRDAQTSQYLAEGTPIEVALIAEAIGFSEVIFDDVGEGFDAGAVLAAHREHVASLRDLASDATETLIDDATVTAAREAEVAAEAQTADALAALEDARAALEG